MIATDIVVNMGHDIRSFFWCYMLPVQKPQIPAGSEKYGEQKKEEKIFDFLEQGDHTLGSRILTPCRDLNPEPLPSNRHALPLSHQLSEMPCQVVMLMVNITQFYHIDIAAVWVHFNDADVGRSHCCPISGHHVTDIVNLIPGIGINIGYNIVPISVT